MYEEIEKELKSREKFKQYVYSSFIKGNPLNIGSMVSNETSRIKNFETFLTTLVTKKLKDVTLSQFTNQRKNV